MTTLCIGRLPDRKKPALWLNDDNHFEILAYFKSTRAADVFMGVMLRAQEQGIVVQGELKPKEQV